MDTLVARDAGSKFKYYYYQPSEPAAILFTVLFALVTLAHFIQMLRTRTWFMIPFVIGAIFETVGYVGRVLSATENPGPYKETPFIIQSVLILVAPALFAASIYMELGRIVLMVQGDKALFIRRTWLTKIFVIGDVLSFLIQAVGAGMEVSSKPDAVSTGKTVVVIGLFLQIGFFGLFVIAAGIFHIRINKTPTHLSPQRPWRKHMHGLYIVSMLILVRSIVRCVEYIQGYTGYIMTHEVFLYVFDGTLMFAAVVSMIWIHPGEVARYVRELKAGNEKAKGVGMSLENGTV